MSISLNEVDKIEVITLQDNYIDLVAQDNSQIVQRALSFPDIDLRNSLIAEHGFSSFITLTKGDKSRSIIFDFGYSAQGAALNAEYLDIELKSAEGAAISHGHFDHIGGLKEIMKRVGKQGLELVVHPASFRNPRYIKSSQGKKVFIPPFLREDVQESKVNLVESKEPYPLLDGDIYFLGEIPKVTDFEKGAPNMFYQDNGQEKWDDLRDDTAVVAKVKGKGLFILSGCAHSGIINTSLYAKEAFDQDNIFVLMGGFHLTGMDKESIIKPTVKNIQTLDPDYVIPTHCTGRNAVMEIEKAMPDRFLLNMVGTRLVFSS